MASTEPLETLEANVAAMNGLQGFDVIVVCCSGEKQAEYWQARLTAVRCVRARRMDDSTMDGWMARGEALAA